MDDDFYEPYENDLEEFELNQLVLDRAAEVEPEPHTCATCFLDDTGEKHDTDLDCVYALMDRVAELEEQLAIAIADPTEQP